MAQIIPLTAVANQTLAVPLAGQNAQLNVYQKGLYLYMDVFLDNEAIIRGVICEDRNRIIRDLYLGFAGDFFFMDMEGVTDPQYTGLNSRYFLVYVPADELPEGVG